MMTNSSNEDVIILEPVKQRFKLKIRHRVDFGFFYITRCLYSIEADGREWQQNLFVAVVGVLTLATIAIDIVTMLCVLLLRLSYYVCKSGLNLLIYAVKVVLNRFLGTVLKWLAIVLIILILYLKWHDISEIIRCWHW